MNTTSTGGPPCGAGGATSAPAPGFPTAQPAVPAPAAARAPPKASARRRLVPLIHPLIPTVPPTRFAHNATAIRPVTAPAGPPAERPNVLFFLPDQHRPDWVPWETPGLPALQLRMPHLAQIAARACASPAPSAPRPSAPPRGPVWPPAGSTTAAALPATTPTTCGGANPGPPGTAGRPARRAAGDAVRHGGTTVGHAAPRAQRPMRSRLEARPTSTPSSAWACALRWGGGAAPLGLAGARDADSRRRWRRRPTLSTRGGGAVAGARILAPERRRPKPLQHQPGRAGEQPERRRGLGVGRAYPVARRSRPEPGVSCAWWLGRHVVGGTAPVGVDRALCAAAVARRAMHREFYGGRGRGFDSLRGDHLPDSGGRPPGPGGRPPEPQGEQSSADPPLVSGLTPGCAGPCEWVSRFALMRDTVQDARWGRRLGGASGAVRRLLSGGRRLADPGQTAGVRAALPPPPPPGARRRSPARPG